MNHAGAPAIRRSFTPKGGPDKLNKEYIENNPMAYQTGPGGLVRCPGCGRRVEMLFKLTAEDIQRRFSLEDVGIFWAGCADCREKLRDAARLEIRYQSRMIVRDVSLMVLLFLFAFSVLKRVWPDYAFLGGAIIVFTAVSAALQRLSGRYAFTHSLAWSMRNRLVLVAPSAMIAGLIAYIVNG